MSRSRPALSAQDRLRVVRGGGGSKPAGVVALQAVLACAVWVAIVWLLFASFVETPPQDQKARVNDPGAVVREQSPLGPARSR